MMKYIGVLYLQK